MNKVNLPFIATTAKQSRVKDALFRLYSSKRMQIFYIVMIIICIFDLISTCIYYVIEIYPVWTLCLDLLISFLFIFDCLVRIYINWLSSFALFKRVWLEFLMIALCIPEIVLLIIGIFSLSKRSSILEIVTIALTGLVLLIRPVVYYSLKKVSVVPSIHLPSSVVESPTLVPEKKADLLRMDTHSSVGLNTKV